MFIPDLDPDFLSIPDPRVKKAPDPGSATLTIEYLYCSNLESCFFHPRRRRNHLGNIIITHYGFHSGFSSLLNSILRHAYKESTKVPCKKYRRNMKEQKSFKFANKFSYNFF
jgi:hypothetical protein